MEKFQDFFQEYFQQDFSDWDSENPLFLNTIFQWILGHFLVFFFLSDIFFQLNFWEFLISRNAIFYQFPVNLLLSF